MTIKNKFILIAGGGSGIGFAAGKLLSERGAIITLLGRKTDKLLNCQQAIHGSCIETCDITDRSNVEKLALRLYECGKLPDIIINSAGVHARRRAFNSITPEDWDYILNANTTGLFNLLHYFVPLMRKRGCGHIINISSVAATQPSVLAGAAYTASKHAVNGLINTVALEEMKHGIRFSTISPGPTNTPLVETREVPPTEIERRKMLQTETVAEAIAFVASLPEGAFIQDLILRPVLQG